MTSETEQAVERERATLLEWLANVNETWSAKELRIIASDAKRMIEAQAAALAHSEARERGLREALTPFAEFATPDPKWMKDEDAVTQGSSMARKQLTMGDCRKARAALTNKTGRQDHV